VEIIKKTLYSLMLSDDVIREIDILAHRLGTNRSALVNQILAEHVSMQTPEQRMNDIFSAIESLMATSRELVPLMTPGTPTMALRSCLSYKYRPTVRYEVELYRNVTDGRIGMLSVIFRTQSAALLDILDRFFHVWVQTESQLPGKRQYTLEDGRFTRSLMLPPDTTDEQLAQNISDYIRLFDKFMKAWVGGEISTDELTDEFLKADIRI